ncbi:MAG: hypothetical protein ACOCRX_05300, partial [Candidatus Woesearchaeota archaeon]
KEKLEILKYQLQKKYDQRIKINKDIKDINSQIKEIEQFFLLKEAEQLKETLEKKGVSFSEMTKAIEKGSIDLPAEDDSLNIDSN